jgi:hypothetical protein
LEELSSDPSIVDLSTVLVNGERVAIVHGDGIVVHDVQSALDLVATVRYDTGCHRMVLPRSAFCADFFDLKTRLAGEILQKFVNHQVKIAVVGDFSQDTSKSLHDFILESNRGNSAFFVADERDAIERLGRV